MCVYGNTSIVVLCLLLHTGEMEFIVHCESVCMLYSGDGQ